MKRARRDTIDATIAASTAPATFPATAMSSRPPKTAEQMFLGDISTDDCPSDLSDDDSNPKPDQSEQKKTTHGVPLRWANPAVLAALDAFLAAEPGFAALDVRAHKGQWYDGPPELNDIITDYSPDGEVFLPKPLPNVDGSLREALDAARPYPLECYDIQRKLDQKFINGETTTDFRNLDVWHTPAAGWTAPGPFGDRFSAMYQYRQNMAHPS